VSKPALLALADGTLFYGISIGATGTTVGECVFNTSMTGYQEILSDPSYYQQIVTLTYPHIGSVGTNDEDQESAKAYAAGLIIRDLPHTMSNFRANSTLGDYLNKHNIIAIADIDTRQLTRHLRDKGAQNACIMAGDIEAQKAIQLAKTAPSLSGMDLAKVVTTDKTYTWDQRAWTLENGYSQLQDSEKKYHVVVYDFGVKYNILRMLADRGCELTIVPAKTSVDEVLALKPDGIFLSNGPGDPAACDYAIENTKKLLAKNIPLFGICLGHQILALASGINTSKMKFGHHGANHPVFDLSAKSVLITSQNHCFTVNEALPDNIIVTHRSLFDDTIQGIKLKDKPAFAFQGHPEASPGPQDVGYLFDDFVAMMQ